MTETPPLRTLIVDDEPLAIERMQVLCAEQPDIALVGTAGDGSAALRMIAALAPDLVLLDIAMPEMDGMSVARALVAAGQPSPAIIFITAFDNFAVDAFGVSAVDYLLKPVAPARLAEAIERVRARVQSRGDGDASSYESEFWVPHRTQLIRIAARDIERIDAERDYMRLQIGERGYLLHQTITALEGKLDPSLFIRLHRSVIVRRDRIASLGHDRAGAWHAELVDGSQVRIGRTHLANAKAMVGK